MTRTILIMLALAVYGLALGCVLVTGDATGKPPADAGASTAPGALQGNLEGLPYRSVTIQLQRTDWIDKYEQSIDEIAALGADTVQFVVDPRMENGSSAKIYLDMRMTPTPEQLGRLLKHAKAKGLRTILMPIVLLDKPRGSEWRGKIAPSLDAGGWEEWWESYRNMIGHFAWIAQENDVDLLVVGSELLSTQNKLDQWKKTIKHVRSLYKGKLTYSSNWDNYTAVPFWNELDLIGMNSYWELGKDRNVSVDEIKDRWKEIQEDLFEFQARQKRPIIFLEIGWFSQTNSANEPWDYTKDLPIDLELQKKLYQGFFESWYGDPRLGGFSVWEWPVGDGGENDGGYTPENKPAEQVLKDYLAKPRWEVK